MSEIVWEDPPPSTAAAANGGLGRLQRLLVELQAHPGKWAVVAKYNLRETAGATGHRMRSWGCETTVRATTLYARWPEGAS